MIKIGVSLLICLYFVAAQLIAQVESIQLHKKIREIRFNEAIRTPLMLMGAGVLAKTDAEFIGLENFYEERNEHLSTFRTHADNYMQYAPIAGILALNAFGVKGQNNFQTQMWLLAKSEFLMMAIVYSLKKFTAEPRPDTGIPNSFPSGHTAQAFAAATFLHKEYGKQNSWYSVLAYGTATSVGVLRVMNNRHWSTDVFFGAGIGILSINLVYLLHNEKKIKKSKMLVVPTYQNETIGINATISIK